MGNHYNYTLVNKGSLLESRKFPDSIIRNTTYGMSVSRDIINVFKDHIYTRENSNTKAVKLSIEYDNKNNVFRIKPYKDGFTFSISESGVGHLYFKPKALREANMPIGKYRRLGTSSVFKLAQ